MAKPVKPGPKKPYSKPTFIVYGNQYDLSGPYSLNTRNIWLRSGPRVRYNLSL